MVTAIELADHAKLGVSAVIGDGHRLVSRAAALSEAGAGVMAFAGEKVSAATLESLKGKLEGSILFCTAKIAETMQFPNCTLLIVLNPRLSFMRAVGLYFPPKSPRARVHPTAVIDSEAVVDSSVFVGAHSVIGEGCRVGAHTLIYENVVLYPGVLIGKRCRINSGTVIGADGFGYERNETGELEKFPHIGGVKIGDDVEIGSNTSVDRGTLGDTVIMDGARIDNQVHISHNVIIGKRAAVIAQAMIGGSVKIGDGAWIAPGAVIMNQVNVGIGATVGLGAVVTKHVFANQIVMGSPAQDEADFKASRNAIKRLLHE